MMATTASLLCCKIRDNLFLSRKQRVNEILRSDSQDLFSRFVMEILAGAPGAWEHAIRDRDELGNGSVVEPGLDPRVFSVSG
jgi:hypothetical protein